MDKNSTLPEFFSRVPKRWIMLVLLIVDIIAILGTIYLAFSKLLMSNPLIFWFVLASIIFTVLLVVFSYFAFADVAKERDKYKDERDKVLGAEQSLIITLHKYAIGLSGMTGYPDEPDNAYWLCLEVFVNPVDKPIDKLDLLIADERIPVNHWPRENVAAFNAYFKVTEWQGKGKNQIELIAYVGDRTGSSGRKTIDFNVEPGGIGHRI